MNLRQAYIQACRRAGVDDLLINQAMQKGDLSSPSEDRSICLAPGETEDQFIDVLKDLILQAINADRKYQQKICLAAEAIRAKQRVSN